MSVENLSRRYAEAFCSLAQDADRLEEAVEALRDLGEILEPALSVIFANPDVSPEERHDVLDAVFSRIREKTSGDDEDLVSLLERFCRLLVDKDRIRYLPTIVDACEAETDRLLGRKRASVRTAFELDDSRRGKLVQELSDRFDADILLNEDIDPDLIAGVQLQIEDYLMDYSIKNQIEQFYERFGSA